MKNKIRFSSILGAAILVMSLFGGGCSTPPTAFESYFFDTKTNVTEHVSTVLTTNATTGAVIANVQTNLLPTVVSEPSVALKTWTGVISGVVNTVSPGSGGIVGIGLLGLASLFGINRHRKLNAALEVADVHETESVNTRIIAENFAQSIEVLREVLKTTPQGQALDVKIVDMLQRNQTSTGLIREAANIVQYTVNNEKAKAAAQKILALLPAQQPA